jgi:hypothetical protein
MLLANIAVTVGNIFGTSVVEQLSVPPSHFLVCLQYPEIFIPLRQTLFLETVRSYSKPKQGNRLGVIFRKLIFGPGTV